MLENTPLQKKLIKTYEDMAELRKVYPSYKALADKVGVSPKYAFYVIKEYIKQSKAFKLK